jgi:hypothetical protein
LISEKEELILGGMGSGRPKTRQRNLVEDCDSLDISFISKYGLTIYPVLAEIENIDGKEFLWINYRKYFFGLCYDLIEYIEILKTYPNFGGERYWLKCPDCHRRVQKIYRPPMKIYFRCRVCHNLMYHSQESNVYDGIRRKMAKAKGMTPRQYDRMVFG